MVDVISTATNEIKYLLWRRVLPCQLCLAKIAYCAWLKNIGIIARERCHGAVLYAVDYGVLAFEQKKSFPPPFLSFLHPPLPGLLLLS